MAPLLFMVLVRAPLLLKAFVGLWPLCCSGLTRQASAVEGTADADDGFGRRRRSPGTRADTAVGAPPADDVWYPTDPSAWQRSEVLAPTEPGVWRRLTHCDGCVAPPRVAIAYRGDYHRKVALSSGTNSAAAVGCSDFFHNADYHWKQLVEPLEAAGTRVTTYFHSYRDASCPQRDHRLLRELRPERYEFSDSHLPMIVDSFIRVLNLVLQDAGSVDAVVLTRFDLRYRAPITSLNVNWNVTNVAHREGEESWKTQRKVSDLFYVLPVAHIRPFMTALRESARKHQVNRVDHHSTGAGHWFSHYFVNMMGRKALHIIDKEFASSTLSPSETNTFLGISRGCSKDYDVCQSH